MAYISARGYSLLKDQLDETEYAKIKTDLSVTPYSPPGYGPMVPVKPNKLWIETPTRIYLPKFYGVLNYGVVPDKRSDGDEVDFVFEGSLREEQEVPVKLVLNAMSDPVTGHGGILNVYCGGGKTTMALYIMSVVQRKTMIVVHKDFLLNQWKERIMQFVPRASIGMVKAKVVDVENKDILLVSLQSLSMKEYAPETFKGVGLAIFDEVHHTSAEVFSRALRKIGSCKCTLGLSATIQRKDGLTKVFIWHLGDVLYTAAQRKDDDVEVRVIPYIHPSPEYCATPTIQSYSASGPKPNVSRMINNLVAFPPRNDVILECIRDIFDREPARKMLILSDRRSHLTELCALIPTACPHLTCGLYLGGMKASALVECESKKIILATYAIASEGYDQRGLDTLILASPRSDVVQSVGRILRDKQGERKHTPTVIDILDEFSVFPRQFDKRKAFYKSSKFKIIAQTTPTNMEPRKPPSGNR